MPTSVSKKSAGNDQKTKQGENMELTEEQMEYFSSDEYRKFYQIARNYQTRSLNVDATSVFFYGVLRGDNNG